MKDFLAEVNRRKKMARAALMVGGLFAATSAAFATNTNTIGNNKDSFGQLLGTIAGWLQGNLGLLLALFGFAGTFLVYLMTHKGSVLFVGVIISLVAGGIVGIVQTFFMAGRSAFEYNGTGSN